MVEPGPTPNEAKFGRLFESNVVGIIVADVHGVIREANDFFLETLGYTCDDLPLRWDVLTPPEWRDQDEAKIAEVLTTGTGVPWEKEYVAKDGRRVPVLVGVALLDEPSGSCIGIVVDLTKRKRAERRLADRNLQLQALATKLVLAEEKERRRIADGLHDDVGHMLATAGMKLGVLSSAAGAPAVKESVEEIRTLLDAAMEATRSLTFDLSSPVLYEVGLEGAVKSLCKQIGADHGIRCHFATDGQPKPIGESRSVVVYRVMRELLFNVVKHAQAQNAWVQVDRDRDQLCLTLVDDGVGFDVFGFGDGFERAGGFGLFNIRQQLDYVGGHIEIDAAPDGGTRIVVVAPLQGVADSDTSPELASVRAKE